jgi:hypothetical protein
MKRRKVPGNCAYRWSCYQGCPSKEYHEENYESGEESWEQLMLPGWEREDDCKD